MCQLRLCFPLNLQLPPVNYLSSRTRALHLAIFAPALTPYLSLIRSPRPKGPNPIGSVRPDYLPLITPAPMDQDPHPSHLLLLCLCFPMSLEFPCANGIWFQQHLFLLLSSLFASLHLLFLSSQSQKGQLHTSLASDPTIYHLSRSNPSHLLLLCLCFSISLEFP